MKRLLIATVLTMVMLAVVAAPAFAYLDPQAGAPVGAPHAVAVAQQSSAGAATRGGGVAMYPGRGMHIGTVPASHGGTSVIALVLAVVIGGAVYAIVADRRRAPAKPAQPARLPAFKPSADQRHKAA